MTMNPFENMMKQAQKMQEDLKKAQQELSCLKVIGEAGAGLVKVTVTGSGDTLGIEIDDSVYSESKTVLQDLIVAACNDAKTKRERLNNEKIKQQMVNLGLPANFNFPFMPT